MMRFILLDMSLYRFKEITNELFIKRIKATRANFMFTRESRMDVGLGLEIILRIVLLLFYMKTDTFQPRIRTIHKEEWWLYQNPRRADIVPINYVKISILLVIAALIGIYMTCRRSRVSELRPLLLGFLLSVLLCGCITDVIKVFVGRPRPDFFYRCHPDGFSGDPESNEINICTGTRATLMEGRKSFPSGHSSTSFAAFGYLSLFLFGQLRVFTGSGSERLWLPVGIRFCLSLLPFLAALCIALSRMVDFHHHVEDVFAGSTLGCIFAFVCYRLYYPSIFSKNPNQSHLVLSDVRQNGRERMEV